MQIKIMLSAVLFLAGWLWSYLFLRQLLFNFAVAYPLIRKMNTLQEGLIGVVAAKRYTFISCVVCTLVSALLLFLIIHFCPLYMIICFAAGGVIALLFLIRLLSPSVRSTFELFCTGYYQFIPDDELRTAMYNKKIPQMKARLKAMGISGTFIPDFKKG